MLLREPFQELRLSNSGSDRNSRDFDPNGSNFNNWRRGGDSNPRYRFKPVRRFSKPLLSTTQPPLRAVSRLLSASLGRCYYIILQFSSALLRGPPLCQELRIAAADEGLMSINSSRPKSS